jgi:hypothetical protein
MSVKLSSLSQLRKERQKNTLQTIETEGKLKRRK